MTISRIGQCLRRKKEKMINLGFFEILRNWMFGRKNCLPETEVIWSSSFFLMFLLTRDFPCLLLETTSHRLIDLANEGNRGYLKQGVCTCKESLPKITKFRTKYSTKTKLKSSVRCDIALPFKVVHHLARCTMILIAQCFISHIKKTIRIAAVPIDLFLSIF